MKPVFTSLILCVALCGVTRAQQASPVTGIRQSESIAQPPPSVGERDSSSSRLEEYMEAGMQVEGIRAPYYDDKGELRAQLYGGQARIMSASEADVTNLRIDVYQDKAVLMTLYAPQCFTKMIEKDGRRVLEVHSDGDVLIDMEQMTVIGKGFYFSSEANKFEIFHESKVLVKEGARQGEGVEL